jgi:hypothetical protein
MDIEKISSDKKEEKIPFFTPEGLSAGKLDDMLKKGIVHFIYKKKPKKGQPEESGETREAWGTRFMDVVDKIPHGGDCPPKNVGYTVYFDIEKGDWRVFSEERLVGVWDHIYSSDEFEKEYSKISK